VDEVIAGWRKLHNEDLCNLFSSQDIMNLIKSKRMRCMEYVACMRELRNECTVLVPRPKGRSPLEKLKMLIGYTIKMGFKEIG
jgi:hypothetical protein